MIRCMIYGLSLLFLFNSTFAGVTGGGGGKLPVEARAILSSLAEIRGLNHGNPAVFLEQLRFRNGNGDLMSIDLDDYQELVEEPQLKNDGSTIQKIIFEDGSTLEFVNEYKFEVENQVLFE